MWSSADRMTPEPATIPRPRAELAPVGHAPDGRDEVATARIDTWPPVATISSIHVVPSSAPRRYGRRPRTGEWIRLGIAVAIGAVAGVVLPLAALMAWTRFG